MSSIKVSVGVQGRSTGRARDHLPITLITSIKMVISPVVSTSVSARD